MLDLTTVSTDQLIEQIAHLKTPHYDDNNHVDTDVPYNIQFKVDIQYEKSKDKTKFTKIALNISAQYETESFVSIDGNSGDTTHRDHNDPIATLELIERHLTLQPWPFTNISYQHNYHDVVDDDQIDGFKFDPLKCLQIIDNYVQFGDWSFPSILKNKHQDRLKYIDSELKKLNQEKATLEKLNPDLTTYEAKPNETPSSNEPKPVIKSKTNFFKTLFKR